MERTDFIGRGWMDDHAQQRTMEAADMPYGVTMQEPAGSAGGQTNATA